MKPQALKGMQWKAWKFGCLCTGNIKKSLVSLCHGLRVTCLRLAFHGIAHIQEETNKVSL